MPRTALEYAIGRPLWVGVVVLNVILAAAATLVCARAYPQDAASMQSILPVLVAVAALWWVFAVTLWLTTLPRRRVTADDIRRSSATVSGGILLSGSKLVPTMTMVSALAAVATFAVVAVTVSGGWRLLWAVLAVLLLGPVISHLISLRQPRRLFLHPRGLGSATFHLDAEVQWDDVQSIDVGVGMNNTMVLKVVVRPGAPSYRERWRHPLWRRRGVIDVDPSALGVDGTLLWLALRLYTLEPSTREELRGDRVPGRLLDAGEALSTTPQHVSAPVLSVFGPEGARR